jgi:aspartate-semialdehyde dehydrogenase
VCWAALALSVNDLSSCLQNTPTLPCTAIGASSRSAGKKYKDAVKWKQATAMAKHVGELVVKECKASEFRDCNVVFSGLDADVAGEIGCPPTTWMKVEE